MYEAEQGYWNQILRPSHDNNELVCVSESDHPYPPTKVMWSPRTFGNTDYLATTADYLRIWKVTDTALERSATMTNVRTRNL